MAIKLDINGFEVTVSDPAEAAALLRELAIASENKSVRRRSNGAASANGRFDEDVAERALRFLKVIDEAENPLQTEEITDALGVRNVKGVGGATKKINNLLRELGFRRKDLVYRNIKKPRQPRAWSSARHTKSAIAALEKKIREQK